MSNKSDRSEWEEERRGKKRQREKLITICSQFETLLLDVLIINTGMRSFTYHVIPDKH